VSQIARARFSRTGSVVAAAVIVAACQGAPKPASTWDSSATPRPQATSSIPSSTPSSAATPEPTPPEPPDIADHLEITAPWTAFPALLQARMEHTATALPDGRIVVAGGYQRNRDASGEERSESLASVEVYVPGYDAWELANPMHHARTGHQAIVLADGRILVFGGWVRDDDRYVRAASAEIYDPETGQWTETEAPVGEPLVRAPILLPDGRVFSLDSFGSYPNHRLRPEIYDPVDGTWTRGARAPEMRIFPAIETLADGSILVAGGAYDVPDGPPNPSNTSWRYDPAADSWTDTALLRTEVFDGAMFRQPNGEVVLLTPFEVQRFDPKTGTWATVTTTGSKSHDGDHFVELNDGRIFVGGSSSCSDFSEQAAIYDPATATWTAAGTLQLGVRSAVTVLSSGNVVSISGGWGCAGLDVSFGPYPDSSVLNVSEIR
jgi:N-acetylneuraminic acid mutarotase